MDVSHITPTAPVPPAPPVPDAGHVADGTFAARLEQVQRTVQPSPPPAHGPTTLGGMLAARVAGATGGVAVPGAALMGLGGQLLTVERVAGPFAPGATVVAPVAGEQTSGFGPRTHPITGALRDHNGIDIAAPTGTPVASVSDGTVVRAEYAGGYGLLVEVDHGNGTTSRYAHMSAIDVAVGDRLRAGQQLGAVGSTGASTGPHLHVEVRRDGEPVDPTGLW